MSSLLKNVVAVEFKGTGVKDDDFVRELVSTSTHDHLLFFTNKGRVYRLKGYEIPEYGRTAKGLASCQSIEVGRR